MEINDRKSNTLQLSTHWYRCTTNSLVPSPSLTSYYQKYILQFLPWFRPNITTATENKEKSKTEESHRKICLCFAHNWQCNSVACVENVHCLGKALQMMMLGFSPKWSCFAKNHQWVLYVCLTVKAFQWQEARQDTVFVSCNIFPKLICK